MDFDIGVLLPGTTVQQRDGITLQDAARHAEDIGLDGAWQGDLFMASP